MKSGSVGRVLALHGGGPRPGGAVLKAFDL